MPSSIPGDRHLPGHEQLCPQGLLPEGTMSVCDNNNCETQHLIKPYLRRLKHLFQVYDVFMFHTF